MTERLRCACGAGPARPLAQSALPAARALGALLDSALLPRSRVLLAHGPDTAARVPGPEQRVSGRHRRDFEAARKDGAFGACPPGVRGAPRGGRCLCAGRLALPGRLGSSGLRIQPRCARMPSRRCGHTRSTGRSDRHLPHHRARGHQRCRRVSAVSPCFDAARRLLHDSELVDVERAQKLHRGVAPTSEVVLRHLRVRAACQSRPWTSVHPLPAACAATKWMPVWRKRLGARLCRLPVRDRWPVEAARCKPRLRAFALLACCLSRPGNPLRKNKGPHCGPNLGGPPMSGNISGGRQAAPTFFPTRDQVAQTWGGPRCLGRSCGPTKEDRCLQRPSRWLASCVGAGGQGCWLGMT